MRGMRDAVVGGTHAEAIVQRRSKVSSSRRLLSTKSPPSILTMPVLGCIDTTAGRPAMAASVCTTTMWWKWFNRVYEGRTLRIMPTFHPSYLLRLGPTAAERTLVWADMLEVVSELTRLSEGRS